MENVSFYKALADSPRSVEIASGFFVGFYTGRLYCGTHFFMI